MPRTDAEREKARKRTAAKRAEDKLWLSTLSDADREAELENRRAKRRAYLAVYNVENAEKLSAYKKKYYQDNKDDIIQGRMDRYWNNLEKEKAEMKIYRDNNPERFKASRKKSKYERKCAVGDLNSTDIKQIMANEIICAYCHLNTAEHLEHCLPLARNGINDPLNCVMACEECNLTKAKKTPLEYLLNWDKTTAKYAVTDNKPELDTLVISDIRDLLNESE